MPLAVNVGVGRVSGLTPAGGRRFSRSELHTMAPLAASDRELLARMHGRGQDPSPNAWRWLPAVTTTQSSPFGAHVS